MTSSDTDEPATAPPLPSPPSFRFENNMSTQSLLSGGGSEYGSRYGSLFGSHFSLTDGSGVYVSSLALTIIISALALVGIILVAVIITLAVILSSCEQQHISTLSLQTLEGEQFCSSFHLNAELNNLQGWTVPSFCELHVSEYIRGGQYLRDFEAAVDSARSYLKTLPTDGGGRYTAVLDVDETALSSLPYYQEHHYGAEEILGPVGLAWMKKARAPAMDPLLNLYHELIHANWNVVFISERHWSEWNMTAQNLIAAGYKSWTALILRSVNEAGLTVQAFKSSKRMELEKQGYQIKCVLGDQWSDLVGPAAGDRSFKLPNPIYHVL